MEQPAQLDLTNREAIIRHMRDLLNLNNLLLNGFDAEWNRVWDAALKAGWTNVQLKEMEEQACTFTVYEQVLPRPDQGCRPR